MADSPVASPPAPWIGLMAGPALTLAAVMGLSLLGPTLPFAYGAVALAMLIAVSAFLGGAGSAVASWTLGLGWFGHTLARPAGPEAAELELMILVGVTNAAAIALFAALRHREEREARAESERVHDEAVRNELASVNARLEALVAARSVEVARDKAFVEALVERLPAAVGFLDRDLVLRWHNPAFARLLERPGERLTGQRLEGCFADVDADARLAPLLHEVLSTGRPCEAAAVPMGARRWDVGVVAVEAADGVLAVLTDVTERVETDRIGRELIAGLSEVDKAKDAFLGVLSHELRTPINVVMGYASLMADGMAGPTTPEQAAFLDRMLEGSEALLTLVNDMLDMGRIRAGRLTVAAGPVAITEVAGAVCDMFVPMAATRGHELRFEAPVGLPVLHADEERLAQVLRILISNAVKFTPEGGTLTVRARVVGERVRMEVADTGIGIAAEDMAKIFRRFEQLDGSATRIEGGTGLGLAIAKSLIEVQGGVIGVESRPGEGSTFWFELPMYEGPDAGGADAFIAPAPRQSPSTA